MLFLDQLKLFD